MSTETMKTTMAEFADAVKGAIEASLGEEHQVQLHNMVNNNDTHRTGLVIRDKNRNIAPVIYLEYYFSEYQSGEPIEDICDRIMFIYKECREKENFDCALFTEFEQIKSRIYCRLVNRKRNQEWLSDIVYSEFLDLALVPYILVSKDEDCIAGYAVKKYMPEIWNISKENLFELAMGNTPRLFRGRVESMNDIIMETIAPEIDKEDAKEFYDMTVHVGDMMPMYVCTNECKINGAGVIFYDGLLKEFSDRIDGDFYILPSSIHETIFVPATEDMEEEYLRSMVRDVNCIQVAQDEILSDNIYYYSRSADSVEIR